MPSGGGARRCCGLSIAVSLLEGRQGPDDGGAVEIAGGCYSFRALQRAEEGAGEHAQREGKNLENFAEFAHAELPSCDGCLLNREERSRNRPTSYRSGSEVGCNFRSGWQSDMHETQPSVYRHSS